jgi:LuxR family transcriptional regulator, positive regulator of biofilm formation
MNGDTQAKPDARRRAQRICILGAKNLSTELLEYALKKEVCESCYIVSDVSGIAESFGSQPAPGSEGGAPAGKNLLLVDCVEHDFDRLMHETAAQKLVIENMLVAIYNVYAGWGIEEEALHLGIKGFFYKQDPLKLFLKGVNAILGNEVWVSREILLRSAMGVRRSKHLSVQEKTGLSAREIEILLLVGGGAPNDEIAEKLFISPHTVKTHLYHIFKKISVPNRLQAALWVAKNL